MVGRLFAAAAGAALAVRLIRSRHRRSLHPDGRSFAGQLEIFGLRRPTGSDLLDHAARYRATVRLSKGIGTAGGRADLRGLAVRAHLPGRDLDLLLSTAGNGRFTRHLPAPRRSFDARYGSITSYRSGTGTKLYLSAQPDPDGPALGRGLAQLAEGDRLLLRVDGRTAGRVVLGAELGPAADAALAFDPVRHASPDLHPTGLVHGVRAYAYRLSQRWRGATPAAANPEAVVRTAGHR